MPPSASANLPRLLVVAPVKAPRTCPKSSDSSSVSGNRGAVHLDQRHLALCAVIVNRARDHFLAGAGFPSDEDGALRLRDDSRGADDLLHAPVLADDAVVVEFRVAFADQIPVVSVQPLVIERAARHHEQLVHLERFLQIVERAKLHRLDGALDGGVCRHHHDLRLFGRGHAAQVPDQIEARQIGHQVVDDQQVEHARRQQPLRFPRAAGGHDLVTFVTKSVGQGVEDFGLVVYQQNGSSRHAYPACNSSHISSQSPSATRYRPRCRCPAGS